MCGYDKGGVGHCGRGCRTFCVGMSKGVQDILCGYVEGGAGHFVLMYCACVEGGVGHCVLV